MLDTPREHVPTCWTSSLREVQQVGYTANLIMIEVGSHGLPNINGFKRLKKELKLTTNQISELMIKVARKVSGTIKIKAIFSLYFNVPFTPFVFLDFFGAFVAK